MIDTTKTVSLVRQATLTDLPALTQIYNHYVNETHVTFDIEAFSVARRTPWFEQFDGKRHQCWVAESGGEVAGYACSTPFKAKAAYETSVEVSIYLAASATGRGIGPALYRELLGALARQDVHRAYAGIAQPNLPSMKLHANFGFRVVSTLSEVGRKFDRYWDVTWLERGF